MSSRPCDRTNQDFALPMRVTPSLIVMDMMIVPYFTCHKMYCCRLIQMRSSYSRFTSFSSNVLSVPIRGDRWRGL